MRCSLASAIGLAVVAICSFFLTETPEKSGAFEGERASEQAMSARITVGNIRPQVLADAESDQPLRPLRPEMAYQDSNEHAQASSFLNAIRNAQDAEKNMLPSETKAGKAFLSMLKAAQDAQQNLPPAQPVPFPFR